MYQRIYVNARFLTQKLTGVQRFAIETSKELRKLYPSDKLIFVCPYNIVQKEIAEILGVTIIGTHIGHLWEQIDLPFFLKKNGKPLLLNLCSTAPILYSSKISTLHDITFIRFPKTFSWKFRLFYRVLTPLICKSSKHILTVSEFSKRELSQFYDLPLDSISVVYNAVTPSFCSRKKNNMKGKYILAVSSLKENKNFPTIISVFLKFQKEFPSIKLYLVGDLYSNSFNSMNELLKTIQENENIECVGRVDDNDLIEYYNNAIAFIFPSLYEGFGIPPLEAQACGCPVVSSNSSSLVEVLNDSALFNDPMDVKGFTDSLKLIINNASLRDELIDKGYTNINRFSWKNSAQKIFDIINLI